MAEQGHKLIIEPRASKRVSLVLPPLHATQRQFVDDPHRIVIAAAGSKWGKSLGCSVWLLQNAWQHKQALVWWVSPILRQSRIGFNYICRFLPPPSSGLVRINRGDMVIHLMHLDGSIRSTIEFRSADIPGSLRGEGVHYAVIDEAAYLSEEAYHSVTTTMTRTRGKMRIISTPCGKNWFYREWLRGAGPDGNGEYKSYQFPVTANPYIPQESIQHLKDNMPERVWQQDALAMFIDDGGTVFHNLSACQTSQLTERPAHGKPYVVGVDFAKHEDYTAIVVMEWNTKQVVHLERYNGLDWNVNIQRCISIAREWNNATIIMDATGVGDVPFDSVRASYPHAIGYKISGNNEKVQLIQKLQFAFEKGLIGIPKPEMQSRQEWRALAEVLQFELSTFAFELNSTGKFIFGAPSGMHDDFPIALALANWQANVQPAQYRFSHRPGL